MQFSPLGWKTRPRQFDGRTGTFIGSAVTALAYVIGHSSGAHSAVLLALDERYLRDLGLPERVVRGFVSLAGPVDTTWTDPDVQALMGPRETWPSTFPRTHIDGTEPPLLSLHGSSDKTVSPSNSIGLAARISARGGCAREILYRGVGHVEIVVALLEPRLGIAPVFNDVVTFITQAGATKCRSVQRSDGGR